MTQNLRWYPMPSLGSFVADDNGTVLVAPMNADGTRSTYSEEVVALGDDSRTDDPALDAQTRRFLLVGQLADGFRSVLRAWLTEAQLVEVDARNRAQENENICHTHDFCDSNMAMFDAFTQVVGRDMVLDSNDPKWSEDSALFNDAWSLAKADGFAATPALELEILEKVAQKITVDMGDYDNASALRLLSDRLKRQLVAPAPYDGSDDAERVK